MEMTSAVIALIGTLFGGAGFKVLEHFLTKKQLKDTTALSLRTELRGEIERRDDELKYYREELKKAEEENDQLRDSYYKLREEFFQAKRELQDELDQLKAGAERAKVILDDKPTDRI